MLNRIGISILVIILTLAAKPALADRKSAAPHYKTGTKEYNLGRFDEAIAAFEKAYEQDPAPILLFNIAQSHRQLGRHERALFFYRRFLDADPAAKNRAAVQARMVELKGLLEHEQRAKAIPLPISPAAPPAHGVAPPPPATDASTPENATHTNASSVPGLTDREASESAPSSTLRLAAYATGGVAVASIITGAVFGRMAVSAGDADSKAPQFDPAKEKSGKSDEMLQYVFLGVGGAALAASAILFVLDDNAEKEEVAIAPFHTASATGLSARMEF
ncbi:MAG: tetratricopeptide repeat protein [Deltaproteobacteria bacterium]|nr:tetratricopeptide repeat protein [Deltaproteobacteria bacterium]